MQQQHVEQGVDAEDPLSRALWRTRLDMTGFLTTRDKTLGTKYPPPQPQGYPPQPLSGPSVLSHRDAPGSLELPRDAPAGPDIRGTQPTLSQPPSFLCSSMLHPLATRPVKLRAVAGHNLTVVLGVLGNAHQMSPKTYI